MVGESGCGKSSVGRTILRLQEPTSGKAVFEGQDVFALDHGALRPLRRRMQIIFQDPYGSLNPRMTIGDAIAEGWRYTGSLPGGDSPAGGGSARRGRTGSGVRQTLSPRVLRGQRQRIGIARALAVEPAFIVCDEPVSALDVSVQAQVLNLLMNLQQRRGLSYLFIAH